MRPACDFKRRGCSATAAVCLEIDSGDGWSFERNACSNHVSLYEHEFEQRGYAVEVVGRYA